jgi:F-type H+-transporting ATPase subunit b
MKTVTALLVLLMLCLWPGSVGAQGHAPATSPATPQTHDPATPPAQVAHPPEDHAEEEEHAEEGGILQTLAKLFNFAVLVGILVYFLRRPIANYLVDRSQQIRHALVEAKTLRDRASADLAKIETRLGELPGELEALKARGANEVKAEQARIKTLAAAERERVLSQTRREIDQQYRLARRALLQETAEQAAAVARTRIERDITPADQTRLIDRYLQQVRA